MYREEHRTQIKERTMDTGQEKNTDTGQEKNTGHRYREEHWIQNTDTGKKT